MGVCVCVLREVLTRGVVSGMLAPRVRSKK